jgi:hypothetical protein
MKILLTAFIVALLLGNVSAGITALPDIPKPKLSAFGAILVAEKILAKSPQAYQIVGVDWAQASTFQPRDRGDLIFSPGKDDPNAYCWFVSYAYHDPDKANPRPFNAIGVVRINNDGTQGAFDGLEGPRT